MSDGLPPASTPVWTAYSIAIGAALGAFGLRLANRRPGAVAFQTAINSDVKHLRGQLECERDFTALRGR